MDDGMEWCLFVRVSCQNYDGRASIGNSFKTWLQISPNGSFPLSSYFVLFILMFLGSALSWLQTLRPSFTCIPSDLRQVCTGLINMPSWREK